MSFEEPDFGETFLKKSITECTARELFTYSYEMFRETFGYKLPSDFIRNQSVLQWLLKTYGEDGAKLVKWLFYKHGGIIDGEAFSINWFASPHKWRIDKELFVMKQALGEIKPKKVLKSKTAGFVSLKELLASGSTS